MNPNGSIDVLSLHLGGRHVGRNRERERDRGGRRRGRRMGAGREERPRGNCHLLHPLPPLPPLPPNPSPHPTTIPDARLFPPGSWFPFPPFCGRITLYPSEIAARAKLPHGNDQLRKKSRTRKTAKPNQTHTHTHTNKMMKMTKNDKRKRNKEKQNKTKPKHGAS